ncbi:MAG TPA: ABC transporter permease [Bryobacteraceae bacterium]|nr:ABC transporter permease [Bryobacteraceae bacterium]
MATLLRDLRYAARILRRSPGFALTAVLTLALGIGANTAIFSVVNATLLRPLPFPHPEQIVAIQNQYKAIGLDSASASVLDYLDYRKQRQLFSEVAAVDSGDFNLTGIDRPERLQCGIATSGLFPVLGVQPILGRVFTYDEDQPGRNSVVVLTEGLWKRRFGGDPSVIGRTLHLNGKPYTVVGVVPSILQWFAPLDAWIPTGFTAEDMAPSHRTTQYLFVVARLQRGVSLARARAGMAAFGATLAKSYPDQYPPSSGWAIRVDSLNELLVGDVRPALLVLLAAVGFVLLIACANVANLLLARAVARTHELSVRAALGAAKWRIARQLLTESLLLGLLGGGGGALLGSWGVGLLVKYGPQQLPRLDEVSMDGRVLAFTAVISLITGLLFGLAPVLQLATANLHDLLKLGARGAVGGLRRHRTRSALVMVEVAMSLVLLVAAGLLLRSFAGLEKVDPGFHAHNVLTFGVALPPAQYDTPARTAGFFHAFLDRVSALPGVEATGAVNPLPFSGSNSSGSFLIEGQNVPEGGTAPHADQRIVTPGYFAAMGIPLRRGRLLNDVDREGAPLAVLIDEALAQQYWKGVDPIGRHLRRPGEKRPWATVVGIVGHVQHNALDSQLRKATLYWSYLQMPSASLEFVVRTAGDPMSLSNAVQQALSSQDKDVPAFDIRTMDHRVAGSLANRRFAVWLLAVFAAIALLLAAVGLYGVMAQTVLQRNREIGVRMALGAQSRDVLGMVVRQAVVLIGGGLIAGIGAALILTSLMKSLLFAVSPADPLTFVLVAVLLSAVALAAAYLPARRATRVDPVTALRYE